MPEYKYTAICHTTCYWLDTRWEIGETYTGNIPPNKHFSESGIKDPSAPPPDAGSDRRSNKELRYTLKEDYGFTAPKKWTRKELWAKLMDMEDTYVRDKLTSDEMPQYIAACGFEAKTNAGIGAHERHCDVCKEIKDGDSS